MRLMLFCVFGIASYALGEEPVEHRSSGDEEQRVLLYSFGSSPLGSNPFLPVVPVPTSYAGVGGFPAATTYGFGGGFGFLPQGGRFPGQGGGFPGQGGGYPGQQGGSSSCRYWCRNPQNQYYCCEGQNQQIGGGGGQVGTKPGSCPPVRPNCPPTRIFGPPRQCSNDYACTGSDKCCFDTCLQHHTCKPAQGYGR